METTTFVELTVPGTPKGKGRPRFWNGRAVTPPETRAAEKEIRQAWEDDGSPRLPDDAPLYLDVRLFVARPESHYLKDGGLSAEGRRHDFPEYKKPDLDNAAKLIMDALNGHAYKDDVQVCSLAVQRHWSSHPRTIIEVGVL